MDLTSFFLSVLASVVAYYICKWLDRDEQLVASLRFKPPTQKRNRKAPELQPPGLFACHHGHLHLFCLLALQHMLFFFSICHHNIFPGYFSELSPKAFNGPCISSEQPATSKVSINPHLGHSSSPESFFHTGISILNLQHRKHDLFKISYCFSSPKFHYKFHFYSG